MITDFIMISQKSSLVFNLLKYSKLKIFIFVFLLYFANCQYYLRDMAAGLYFFELIRAICIKSNSNPKASNSNQGVIYQALIINLFQD